MLIVYILRARMHHILLFETNAEIVYSTHNIKIGVFNNLIYKENLRC